MDEALQLPQGAEREAFLDHVCKGNASLRQQVLDLLESHQHAGDFFDHSAFEGSETSLAEVPITEGFGTFIGRYKLLEKIGEGGMGVVYMAEQTEPVSRKVALKIIKLGMDTKHVVARFEAERQALALMDHPHIAKVLDGGATETGRPYFVMELVQGIPITDFCDKNKFTTKERIELFIPVCQAIQSAHQKGIIHRDIKPNNVLVSFLHGEPVAKVIDFGIAKATNQKLTEKTLFTQFASMVGTPAYMSPEQAEMSVIDIDTRTDVYSLGVLLYELLTGTTPFLEERLRSAGYGEMRRIIAEEDPEKPSTRLSTMAGQLKASVSKLRQSDVLELQRNFVGDLDWITMKCLEKDRRRRYDTADGLAADLRRHLGDEPVMAAAPSVRYRFQKAWRRNKVVYSAATLVFSTLVIGMWISIWQTMVATKAKNVALAAETEKEVQRLEAEAARAAESEIRRSAQEQERNAKKRAYASDMNLAQRALEQNNVGRAKKLIERYRPNDGAEELPGWEWRYLWQSTRSDAIETIWNQSEPINTLAVSKDSKWLTFTQNVPARDPRPFRNTEELISLMDLNTRQVVTNWYSDTGLMAFSPTRSELVWIGVKDQGADKNTDLWIWDLELGKIRDQITLTNAYLSGLAFYGDGKTLITSCRRITTKKFQGGTSTSSSSHLDFWRFSDGTFLRRLELSSPIEPRGNELLVTSDGSMGIWCNGSNTLCAVDLSTGRQIWTIQATDDMKIQSLALSGDDKTLVTGPAYTDGTIGVWDAATGKQIGTLNGHRSWVSGLQFLPNGNLVSSSADQTIRLWDMDRLESIRVFNGHDREVWALTRLPKDGSILSGSKDGSIKRWDITSSSHMEFPIRVEESQVYGRRSWQLSPDGRSLFEANLIDYHPPENLGKYQIYERNGRDFQDKTVWPQSFRHFPTPAFSESRWMMAAVSEAGTLQIWDTQLRRLSHEWEIPFGTGPVLGFDGTGKRIWLVQKEGNEFFYYEWEIESGRKLHRVKQNKDEFDYRNIDCCSSDLKWAYHGFFGGKEFRLRQTPAGESVRLALNLYREQRQLFTPDSKHLLIADNQSGWISKWSVEDLWEHPGHPTQIATLPGMLRSIGAMACSLDGSRLVAGSGDDELLKLYDLNSGLELLTFSGEGIVNAVGFSADGNVLACDTGKQFYIWRAPTFQEIKNAESQILELRQQD